MANPNILKPEETEQEITKAIWPTFEWNNKQTNKPKNLELYP